MKQTTQYKRSITLRNMVIYLILFFSIWIIRGFLYKYVELPLDNDLQKTMISIVWKWSVWVIVPTLYVAFIDKKNVVEFFALTGKEKDLWKWILGIFIICCVWQAVLLITNLDKTYPDITRIISIFLGSGIPEEYLFRGFIFVKLQELTNLRNAIVLTSLLFLFAHYPGWFIFAPHTILGFIKDSIYIFSISCLWCWIRYKSKSLYPSMWFHGLNNVIAT